MDQPSGTICHSSRFVYGGTGAGKEAKGAGKVNHGILPHPGFGLLA
jgi:hypothetical protein